MRLFPRSRRLHFRRRNWKRTRRDHRRIGGSNRFDGLRENPRTPHGSRKRQGKSESPGTYVQILIGRMRQGDTGSMRPAYRRHRNSRRRGEDRKIRLRSMELRTCDGSFRNHRRDLRSAETPKTDGFINASAVKTALFCAPKRKMVPWNK
jgi:hypothetical protein